MAGYNLTRSVEELLARTESSPPSFTIHLHPEYWTLNNGSKFLYNNQVASLLDDIRAHRIPVDFLELFDSARVPFYDGCMIVELLDYRPQRNKEPALEKPDRSRVVLHPNSETIWADICLLNQKSECKWTDKDALQIEARILIATAPPLCLDPNPHLTRIANNVLRVSTPAVPVSLKRKASVLDPEEDESDKVRRAKIMQFMNPRPNRSHVASFRFLDAVEKVKAVLESRPLPSPPNLPPNNPPLPPFVPPAPAILPNATTATTASDEGKKKAKTTRKNTNASQHNANTNTSQPTYPTTERGDSTPQHVPPQMIMSHYQTKPQKQHQTQIPPQPNGQSHVFAANIQNASGDSSKRVGSPAQFAQTSQMSPTQIPPHPQHPQHPQAKMPAFQPPIPPTHFGNATAASRANQAKAPNGSGPAAQQQQPPQVNPSQMQQIYAQHMQSQQQPRPGSAQQQRLSQGGAQNGNNNNGRSTPQQHPPIHPSVTRSPMAANQAAATRSPMVQNAQSIPQQMTHPPQHITFQNQYNPSHLRPVAHTNSGSSHPQTLPSHLVNGSVQAAPSQIGPQGQQVSSQDQVNHPQPMMPQYQHMYSYPQMGMNYPMQAGRIPPGYPWPMGLGRGIPGVGNGQHIPGMPPGGHPQQMPLGVGKAVPGNLQR